jgi:nitroimidazol reductase NimA-like FMN-containing flavoprotein (pyridoxamine 5'-phosphate oxidase superfamily)
MATTPVTTLDQRFSGAKAVATTWDETLAVIESAELFWLTTVRKDGRPHVTPLVAVWLDGALHFSCGVDEQKSVNLRANPNVVLTTGCNGWDSGIDVVVEGEAIEVSNEHQLAHLADAWTLKWDGDSWKYEIRDGRFHHPGDDPEVISVFAVKPTKVFAFAKGNFAHTKHQF